MATISQTIFSDVFSWTKKIIFWLRFHSILSLRVQSTIFFSIGLANGLAPIGRQVITWTNADPIHWHIYAALGWVKGQSYRNRCFLSGYPEQTGGQWCCPQVETHITLTSWWPRWRLKSPASRLFTRPFIQTQIKENIKAPRRWSLCGEFTGTGEFPAQRASYAENVSIWWHHHDLSLFDIIVMGPMMFPVCGVMELSAHSPGQNGPVFADDILRCISWMKRFLFW